MYRAGAHVIELAVDDPAAVAFLDSFLERANPTEAGERRCLATISVADEPLGESAAPVEIHGTVGFAKTRTGFEVGRASANVPADFGEVLAVLRKLVRLVWLSHEAPDGGYFYLHASAVDDGQDVYIFSGDKRGGKTTLMLDAVAHHGFSLVTNDGLLFSGAGDSLVMSPLPTLAKVRADVAHRFMPFLLARADDTFNAAQLDQWRRSGHKHWTDTPLYLTFGALGQRFSSIPVSERRVHLVGVRFADPEAPVSLTRLEGRDALDVLLANRKELVPSFADVMDFAAEQAGAESRLVREIASRLHVVRFRHEGEVKPALYSGSRRAS
jgi:hypothetical protein